ncbi:unnamed protein product [Cochlearia groenlandica]
MSSRSSRTLYVGNLPGDIREREVEDLFSKYGHVAQIDLKIPPRPPGYAFVEFDDARDAEDAIHGRDGYDFDGHRLRVELAHGGRRSTDDARSSYNGGGRGGGRGGGGDRGRGPSRKSEFRVLVTGLPSSASWQDLKDHMRKGGDVCFSQVYRDGRGTTGVVDYTCYEDMKYAVKKLDDTEFRNAFSHGYVRVREYESRKDSRSPSRGRSYSRSRSSSRGRSLSRSRSPKGKSSRRSPAKGRSKSPGSRSKSRSQSPRRSRSRSRSPLPSIQKDASKSPSKPPSPAKSPIRRSRSRSPIPLHYPDPELSHMLNSCPKERRSKLKSFERPSCLILNRFIKLVEKWTRVSSDFPPGFVFGSGTSAYQVLLTKTGELLAFGMFLLMQDNLLEQLEMWHVTRRCEAYGRHWIRGLTDFQYPVQGFYQVEGRGLVNSKGGKGLQYFYNNLIDELITHVIQPHVTLHHF